MRKTPELAIRIICIFVIFAAIFLAILLVDFRVIEDRFRALSYSPTSEMSQLRAQLNLTERAQLIFNASHPELEQRESFNQHCQSKDPSVSILGCYSGSKIYIFNIDNTSLHGIRKSTLAHELLHAAWERLSSSQQKDLEPALNQIYEQHYEVLEPRLKLYPEEVFLEELHSAVGTEYTDLPQTLEDHYANYFNNQDHIVSYFTNYNTKFQALKNEAESLYSSITKNQELIDAKTQNYNDAITELNAAIADFNRRAESGFFESQAAFNAERTTLLNRQQDLRNLSIEVSDLVDSTNELIEQYNNNIARTQVLIDSINSNTIPSSEIDE